MLKLIIICKAIVEVALLSLAGQGILYVFAGRNRETNFFYGVLRVLTSPATRLTRFMAPRFIEDRFIGVLSFFLILVLWFALILAKLKYLR